MSGGDAEARVGPAMFRSSADRSPIELAQLPAVGAEWPFELSAAAKTVVALAGCLLLAATLAFHELGVRGIFSPAEARYSLIAREMLESGDWIQPRLNHVRYDEKPPLLYWSIAACYRIFGASDFTSRVPSALAYVGTAGLTFAIARELVGSPAAPLAALIYSTSIGPFLFGRFVFTDTLLTFCTTLSLFGLSAIARGQPGRGAALALYLGAAGAVLAKGPVGLVFPLATAASYGLWFRDPCFRRRLRPLLGLAVLAIVALPWHVALARRDPSFLDFYVFNEQVRRFLHTREPIDYVSLSIVGFWMSTLFWLLPWTLFLPGALGNAIRNDRRRLAIPLLWSASVIGFFTLARSRLEYYALPAVPALAVIVAAYWQRGFELRVRKWEFQLSAIVLVVAAAASAPKLFLFPRGGVDLLTAMVSNVDGYYREYFVLHPGESFAMVSEALRLARPFVILLFLIGSGMILLLNMARRRLAFTLLVAGIVPCLAIVDLGMRLVAADRSQRDLAEIIDRNWSEGSKLMVVGPYEDFCGVTYYTRRGTQMVDGFTEDLLFGYRKGDAADLFLSPQDFEREWHSPTRVFVVSDKSFPLPGATVLGEGPRDVLRTNHPLASRLARAVR